jgi:Ca-activated chloride channel family protein
MTRLVPSQVIVLAAATSLVAQPRPIFRAGTELVTIGVTVTDRRGIFITDLEAEHFDVLEDGRPQTITYFARGDAAASAPDLHVGLLLDTSGSMGADIQMARTAAIKFLDRFREAKAMTVVDFDSEVRLAKYGPHDFPRMVERIRSRRPVGLTALYDALALYLDSAVGEQGRKVLVLFTDGGDTRSVLGLGDIMDAIRASDVTIHAVGFLQNQPQSVRTDQRFRLSRIAEESGGEAFFPYSMKEIDAAYDRVAAQIRAQYSLGYVSTNQTADGQWRKVEIRVRRPDLKDLRIQARKGYFAPYRP